MPYGICNNELTNSINYLPRSASIFLSIQTAKNGEISASGNCLISFAHLKRKRKQAYIFKKFSRTQEHI